MRIGIISPKEIITDITQFLENEFADIIFIPFVYNSITEIPELISGHQNKVNALLFLGETARLYTEKMLSHSTEWVSVPRSPSALLRILFQANVAGYNMKIATDFDNKEFFKSSFHEVGLTEKDTHVEILPFFPFNEGLLIKDAYRLEQLYKEGKAEFCITMFYKVWEILKQKKYSCLYPTTFI